MSLFTEEKIYVYLGFTGGLLLAFAQVPQIYRVHVRRSSGDISYTYQLFFAVGLVMFMIYYGYYERWAVFITSGLSFLSILYMTGLKVYLEEFAPRSRRRNGSGNLGSALLDADQLDGRRSARVRDDVNGH